MDEAAVPEGYGRDGEWQSVRQRIEKVGRPTIEDMEALLDELQLLCETLEADGDRAREAFTQASAHRDQMADACTKAEELLKFFGQLEKAVQDKKTLKKLMSWSGTLKETAYLKESENLNP